MGRDLGFADLVGEFRALVGQRVLVQMLSHRAAADKLEVRGVLGEPRLVSDLLVVIPVGAEAELILHFDQVAQRGADGTFESAYLSDEGGLWVSLKGGMAVTCHPE